MAGCVRNADGVCAGVGVGVCVMRPLPPKPYPLLTNHPPPINRTHFTPKPIPPTHPTRPTHPTYTQDDRRDREAWERRRSLEIEREQAEAGLWGRVRGLGRRMVGNLPVLFLVPFVLLAAVQLSGIAIATAVIAALVVASFSLPVMALGLVVPLAIVLLLGTIAFPIVPFAVFTLAPAVAVAPLVIFLGWLLVQLASGPTVIREDSLFNSFGGVPLDEFLRGVDEETGRQGGGSGSSSAQQRGVGRRGAVGGDDGVIDVEAEVDTDAEAEEELRRFDERLRRGSSKGDDRKW
jgi:hypothetical protein